MPLLPWKERPTFTYRRVHPHAKPSSGSQSANTSPSCSIVRCEPSLSAPTTHISRPRPPENGTTLSEINQIQKWLDTNLDHPDRQSQISRLVTCAAQYNGDNLPLGLFVAGIFLEGNGLHPVASGSFADVYRGIHTGKYVAIKRFRASMFIGSEGKDKVYKRFFREALIWRQLRHPCILPFLGVDYDAYRFRTSLGMVSPWMSQGTLMEYLGKAGEFIDHQNLIVDVASGIGYLHSQSFAHGDLHGSNVYIDHFNRALLGDFGLTAITDMAYLAATTTINKAGASRWLSPELVHQDDGPPPRKTASGDIFAFGRICLCVYTRQVPFHAVPSDAGVILRVITHRHPQRPSEDETCGMRLPDQLWELIMRCWQAEPEKRPVITSIENELLKLEF